MTAVLRALKILIVKGIHPISIVDDTHFKNFVSVLDPRVKLPCRSTMTTKYLFTMTTKSLHSSMKKQKKKLVEELYGVDDVALTTDLSSSRKNMSYMTYHSLHI